ncbi:hypothetical protein Tco_0413302 [Tanacetum coccineum]
MSSPNRSTSDFEDAFSSMNILNYTSVSPDYFPASSESSSFNSSENSKDNMIQPRILESISGITTVLLFNPRYCFVHEEFLPPLRKNLTPIFFSSTTVSNPYQNLPNTPTAPQILEIGKSSIKMHLKHHEEQIEDILNYLDEISFHRIEKMEEGHITGNELKTEFKRIHTQIIKLQKKQLGQKDCLCSLQNFLS